MSQRFAEPIRPDLWNAVMDYRSQKRYIWDGERAIPVEGNQEVEGPVLPTVTSAEFVEWKRTFATSQRVEADPDLNRRLDSWAERNFPTRLLPLRMQGAWNATIKDKVRARLDQWFTERQLKPPTELGTATTKAERVTPDKAPELRRALVQAIERMTYRELLEIRIPATALLRRKEDQ